MPTESSTHGCDQKKAGVDFVPTGNETLLDYIAAVIGGGAPVEFPAQEGEKSPAPLELGDIEIAALREQAKGFHLVGYELELTGYCPECAPRMGNGARTFSN